MGYKRKLMLRSESKANLFKDFTFSSLAFFASQLIICLGPFTHLVYFGTDSTGKTICFACFFLSEVSERIHIVYRKHISVISDVTTTFWRLQQSESLIRIDGKSINHLWIILIEINPAILPSFFKVNDITCWILTTFRQTAHITLFNQIQNHISPIQNHKGVMAPRKSIDSSQTNLNIICCWPCTINGRSHIHYTLFQHRDNVRNHIVFCKSNKTFVIAFLLRFFFPECFP